MTDEMAEQTPIWPRPRLLGQLLCPEVTLWWLSALGTDPKHPGSKMTGFLGDKWTVSFRVLTVTKDRLEQGFSNLAAIQNPLPGQSNRNPWRGMPRHPRFSKLLRWF